MTGRSGSGSRRSREPDSSATPEPAAPDGEAAGAAVSPRARRREVPGSAELLAAARKLLADGRWHDYEQVVAQLSRKVMPGQAARQTERSRAYLASKRAQARREDPARAGHGGPLADPGRVRYLDSDAVVASGARHIVRKLLYRREFEIYPHGYVSGKKVRLRKKPRPGRGTK